MRALVTILGTLVASSAVAQEDIIRPPLEESGRYQMSVEVQTQDPEDLDVFEACCDRIDVDPVIQLGCAPRTGTDQVISFQVDIVKTPGDDGEVKCYLNNSEDKSDYSHNSYIVVFPLRPNAPTLR